MKVDILVLNAAVTGSIRIGETASMESAEEMQRFLVGNIQTPALIVDQLVRRRMFQAESRIVLISSIRSKLSISTS
jgi:NAD(P)-dependent dehydrogenase (short-subunit alcohol dehydrogenase family)